jgi:hypothetical protein
MRTEQTIYEALTIDLATLDPNRRFGISGKPIPATEVYRRVVSTLMRNGIRSERWILVNERTHTVTFVTTYNGVAGTHYDVTKNTQWLSWETLRPRLEEYQFVPTDECPVAIAAPRLSASVSDNRQEHQSAFQYGV